MNEDLINQLLNDEAVAFIAERHQLSPKEVIDNCLYPQKQSVAQLEENEIQIISDLITMYKAV